MKRRQSNSIPETGIHEPIFLVGMPRSGTTLIATILNRHSRIAIAPESHFFPKLSRLMPEPSSIQVTDSYLIALGDYLDSPPLQDYGFSKEQKARILDVAENTPFDARRFFIMLMVEYAKGQAKSAARYGEKTPRHLEYINQIRQYFQDATFIGIVRDPRDVVASLQKVPFNSHGPDANARRWVKYARILHQQSKDPSSSSSFMWLKYEDLVVDPERVVREICYRLNVEFEASMLANPKQSLSTNFSPDREPWKSQALQPVTTANIGKWRQSLAKQQALTVELICTDEMSRYGYAPEATRSASSLVVSGVRLRLAAYDLNRLARKNIRRFRSRLLTVILRAAGRNHKTRRH